MVTLNINVLIVAVVVLQIVLLATKQWVPSLIISLVALAWVGMSFTAQKISPKPISIVSASPVTTTLSPVTATSIPLPDPSGLGYNTQLPPGVEVPSTITTFDPSTGVIEKFDGNGRPLRPRTYGTTVTGIATGKTRDSNRTKIEPDRWGLGYTVKLPEVEVPSKRLSSGRRLALTYKPAQRPRLNAKAKRWRRQVKWNPVARNSIGDLSNMSFDELNDIASKFVDTDITKDT